MGNEKSKDVEVCATDNMEDRPVRIPVLLKDIIVAEYDVLVAERGITLHVHILPEVRPRKPALHNSCKEVGKERLRFTIMSGESENRLAQILRIDDTKFKKMYQEVDARFAFLGGRLAGESSQSASHECEDNTLEVLRDIYHGVTVEPKEFAEARDGDPSDVVSGLRNN